MSGPTAEHINGRNYGTLWNYTLGKKFWNNMELYKRSNETEQLRRQRRLRWNSWEKQLKSTNHCLHDGLWGVSRVLNVRGACCYCWCHHLASKDHSVAPWWPRLTACLQRFTGDRLLSLWIWSTHLLWGRPGHQCHWLLSSWPRDRLT